MATETRRHGEKKLLKRFCKMFRCDTARISRPMGTMFLIIGHNRNTKDGDGEWHDGSGQRIDFNYIEEHVIARGQNHRELIASAKRYKRLCGMTWEEFFKTPRLRDSVAKLSK